MDNRRIFLLTPLVDNDKHPRLMIWSDDPVTARTNAVPVIPAASRKNNNQPQDVMRENFYEDEANSSIQELKIDDFDNFEFTKDQILIEYESHNYTLNINDPVEVA